MLIGCLHTQRCMTVAILGQDISWQHTFLVLRGFTFCATMPKFDAAAERLKASEMRIQSEQRMSLADAKELSQIVHRNLHIAKGVLQYAKSVILNEDRRARTQLAIDSSIGFIAPGSPCHTVHTSDAASSHGGSGPLILHLDSEKQETTGGGDSVGDDGNPPRTVKVHKLPVKDLRTLVTALEKVSLSAFAIRALCKGQQREASQDALSEILEFCTGISLLSSINWDDWGGELTGLVTHMQELNGIKGRKARELELPPKWHLVGHYEKLIKDGIAAILNRYSKVWSP
jgi:hypothetical protein